MSEEAGSGNRALRALKLAGLVAASLLVSLLLAEAALRLTWSYSAPGHDHGNKRMLKAPPGEKDLVTVFELNQRSIDGWHKGVPYRTNSARFRGPEVTLEPAPGVFRIVVIGDSVTMGSGVREEDAYAGRLAALLDAARPDARHEVLNLGLSGLNTDRIVNRLESIGLPRHPDMIVYGYTLNDVEGRAYVNTIRKGSYVEMLREYEKAVESPSYLWRALRPRWLTFRANYLQPVGTMQHDLFYNYFDNPAAWQQVADGLALLGRISRARGICTLVFLHTGTNELVWGMRVGPLFNLVTRTAKAEGLYVAPSRPWLEGVRPADLRLHRFDSHPNELGHEKLSEALLAGLLALPERCWTR
ncbi:MAG: hypothetical protein IH884_07020 [Myxococcales bacterium]|nr:hypothetical protein [Myxococcales bacterium]